MCSDPCRCSYFFFHRGGVVFTKCFLIKKCFLYVESKFAVELENRGYTLIWGREVLQPERYVSHSTSWVWIPVVPVHKVTDLKLCKLSQTTFQKTPRVQGLLAGVLTRKRWSLGRRKKHFWILATQESRIIKVLWKHIALVEGLPGLRSK